MTLPALLFGVIVATLCGALFHLWRGGGLGRLALYLVLGWAGFAAGHFLAASQNWQIGRLGPLHLGPAIAGAFLFLLLGYWLSLVDIERK